MFIKRAVHEKDPWSGQMGFPGGRRDPADRDLRATVEREVREETGIDLGEGIHLGELDDLHPNIPALPPVVVRPFVYLFPAIPNTTPNEEIDEVFWYPVDEFQGRGERITVEVRGTRREVFGYRFDGNVVWGMTERILTPLLERIDGRFRT